MKFSVYLVAAFLLSSCSALKMYNEFFYEGFKHYKDVLEGRNRTIINTIFSPKNESEAGKHHTPIIRSRRQVFGQPPGTNEFCPPNSGSCPYCPANLNELLDFDICSYPIILRALVMRPPRKGGFQRTCGEFGISRYMGHPTDITLFRRLLKFSKFENCDCILQQSKHYILISTESNWHRDDSKISKISLSSDAIIVPEDTFTGKEVAERLNACQTGSLKVAPESTQTYPVQEPPMQNSYLSGSNYYPTKQSPTYKPTPVYAPQTPGYNKPQSPPIYIPQKPHSTYVPPDDVNKPQALSYIPPYQQKPTPTPLIYRPPSPVYENQPYGPTRQNPFSYTKAPNIPVTRSFYVTESTYVKQTAKPYVPSLSQNSPSIVSSGIPDATKCPTPDDSCPICDNYEKEAVDEAYCNSAHDTIIAIGIKRKSKVMYTDSPGQNSCMRIAARNYFDVSQGKEPKRLSLDSSIFIPSHCRCLQLLDGPKVLLVLGTNSAPRPSTVTQLTEGHKVFLLPTGDIILPKCKTPPDYSSMECSAGIEESCPICALELDASLENIFCSSSFAILAQVQDKGLYSSSVILLPNISVSAFGDYNEKLIRVSIRKPPNRCRQGSLYVLENFWSNDYIQFLTYVSLIKCDCPLFSAPTGYGVLIFSLNPPIQLSEGTIQLTKQTFVVPVPHGGIYLPSCRANVVPETTTLTLPPVPPTTQPPPYDPCLEPQTTCPICQDYVPQNIYDYYCQSEFAMIFAMGLDYTKTAKERGTDKPALYFGYRNAPEIKIESSEYGTKILIEVIPSRFSETRGAPTSPDRCYTEKVTVLYDITKASNPYEQILDLDCYVPSNCQCNVFESAPGFGILMGSKKPSFSKQLTSLQLTDQFSYFPLAAGTHRLPECGGSTGPSDKDARAYEQALVSYGQKPLSIPQGYSSSRSNCPSGTVAECPSCHLGMPEDMLQQFCNFQFAVIARIADMTDAPSRYIPSLKVSKISTAGQQRRLNIEVDHTSLDAAYKAPDLKFSRSKRAIQQCRQIQMQVIKDLRGGTYTSTTLQTFMIDTCKCHFTDLSNGYAIVFANTPPIETSTLGFQLKDEIHVVCLSFGVMSIPSCSSESIIYEEERPTEVLYGSPTTTYAPPTTTTTYVPPPTTTTYVLPPTTTTYVPPPTTTTYVLPPTTKTYVPPPTTKTYVPPPTTTTYRPPTTTSIYTQLPITTTYSPSSQVYSLNTRSTMEYFPPIKSSNNPSMQIDCFNNVLSCPMCDDSPISDEVYCGSRQSLLVVSVDFQQPPKHTCNKGSFYVLYDVTARRPSTKTPAEIQYTVSNNCICSSLNSNRVTLLVFGEPGEYIPTIPSEVQLTASIHLHHLPVGKILTLPSCESGNLYSARSKNTENIILPDVDSELKALRNGIGKVSLCPDQLDSQAELSCPQCVLHILNDSQLHQIICSNANAWITSHGQSTPALTNIPNQIIVSQAISDSERGINILINEDKCRQTLQKISCNSNTTRFFFNNETQKCEELKSIACDENDNTFDDLQSCKSACMRDLNCKQGQLSLLQNFLSKEISLTHDNVEYIMASHCNCSHLYKSQKFLLVHNTSPNYNSSILLNEDFQIIPLSEENKLENISC